MGHFWADQLIFQINSFFFKIYMYINNIKFTKKIELNFSPPANLTDLSVECFVSREMKTTRKIIKEFQEIFEY